MKTSRMLEIVYFLLENNRSTAPELAKKFNVSTKTIYRDIDELSKAGVPVQMQQGVSGGVMISSDYAVNKHKMTAKETEDLLKALKEIKIAPNAKLEYVLGTLKKYFNESATMWVNCDDVSLAIQEKFHKLKVATIERRMIICKYYDNNDFKQLRLEPYELRFKDNKWKLVAKFEKSDRFEELYISRLTDIDISDKIFKRNELPDEYGKKYSGEIKTVKFEVLKLTDELLDTFPIECLRYEENKKYFHIRVKAEDEKSILNKFNEDLNLI